MAEKLLPDGLKLLLVGQITVLSFIGCIVLTIKSIAWFVETLKGKSPNLLPPPTKPEPESDEAIAAAIAAAIHKERTGGVS